MKIINKLIYILVLSYLIIPLSCSTTKKLGEGEVLYTGVKKMDLETVKDVKLKGNKKSAIKAPLSYPPNNPLISPYVRTPLPIGLWVYNWNIREEKGLKYWLYKRLAKKPVLISDVKPELRIQAAANAARDYGHFGSEYSYEVVYNKRNPKKAKISYYMHIHEPHLIGSIDYWRFTPQIDTILTRINSWSLVKPGDEYNLNNLEEERERITRVLRNRGYYYFRSDFIEFLADTTISEGIVDIRTSLKPEVDSSTLQVYRIKEVNYTIDRNFTEERDSMMVNNILVRYNKPLELRPRVIERSIDLIPGELFSLQRQNRTISHLTRLGIFKFTNIAAEKIDSVPLPEEGALRFNITSEHDLPLEFEIDGGVTAKSNNLIGPGLTLGLTHKNLFHGGENISFKLNGSYEWETGNRRGKGNGIINSYELGFSVNLTYPRLLMPRFIRISNDFPKHTTFQLGVDMLSRNRYFKMISFSGSMKYDFQTSRYVYHTVLPFKLTYNHLMKTSVEFDSIMREYPAIAKSFENQLIPTMSYSYKMDRPATRRSPNHFYMQHTISQAGNIIAGVQSLFGNHKGEGKKIFGNVYSQFLKLTSEVVFYRRLTEKVTLAHRFYGGIGYSYGNSKVMPYSEQFYIGGANSIRAFTIRTIGPGTYHKDTVDRRSYLDQTGDIKLEANIELRFNMGGRLNGAVFVDTGNIWLLRKDVNRPGGEFRTKGFWNMLALGTGFGIRYDIDYLVVRADVGIGLHTPYKNPDKPGYFNIKGFNDRVAFHLAIGYPF